MNRLHAPKTPYAESFDNVQVIALDIYLLNSLFLTLFLFAIQITIYHNVKEK